jgi:hypothetical protein
MLKRPHIQFLLWAFIILVLGQFADFFSSLGPLPAGYGEDNPFCRYADGSFYVWHGAVVKFFAITYAVIFSAIVYAALRRWSKNVASRVASVPMLYMALRGLWVVITNLMMHWGWYVPAPGE